MHKFVTFLVKKKKDTAPWKNIDKEEESIKINKHHNRNKHHHSSTNVYSNRSSSSSTSSSNKVKKKKKVVEKISSINADSDDDSDELIPGEVRTISKTIDFSKSERKWLTSNLNLSPELIDQNLPALLNVLNFLGKREGILYRYASPIVSNGASGKASISKHSSNPTKLSSLPSSSSLASPSSSSSSSTSSSILNTNNSNNSQNNNHNNDVGDHQNNNQISLKNSTNEITNSGNTTTTTTITSPTLNSTNNTTTINGNDNLRSSSNNNQTNNNSNTIVVIEQTNLKTTTNLPTIRHRGDYNRIFIEPGKHYTFPEQESLAMAWLVAEEEDPSKLFRVGENMEIKGAFGTVYQVYYHNNLIHSNEMALKKMDHKSERNRRNNLNEIALLRYLKHPNIVTYINSYEKNDEEIWMVMEYMDGGTINEAITNFTFTEKYVAFIIKNILQGLVYLHSLNIAHRDLKSENIMLNSKAEVKIIDFGFSIDLTNLKGDIHMCGSPFWMSPEQIQEKPHDTAVDIWSLGIIVVEMMKGVVPHRRSKIKAMFLTASTGLKFSREKKYSSHWSNELFDFLDCCLQIDPKKRFTAAQLLEHPFIASAATKQEMLELLPLLFISKTISKYSSS